jgi:hypothetical protein
VYGASGFSQLALREGRGEARAHLIFWTWGVHLRGVYKQHFAQISTLIAIDVQDLGSKSHGAPKASIEGDQSS